MVVKWRWLCTTKIFYEFGALAKGGAKWFILYYTRWCLELHSTWGGVLTLWWESKVCKCSLLYKGLLLHSDL